MIEPIYDTDIESVLSLIKTKEPIIAMLDTQSALHGFRVMYLDKLQGLPVIDTHGNVVANFSASDMRGLEITKLQSLSKPVFEYLESMAHKSATPVKVDQLRTITTKSTVEETVNILMKEKIHRIWVTGNDNEKLTGVVTLTDVLRLVQPIHLE